MIIIRIISIVLFSLLIVNGAFADKDDMQQGEPADPDSSYGGKLTCENALWDFGYIPGKSLVKHIYIIKNSGDDSLKITKVKPTCGCTSAPLKKNILAPGESTELEIGFKTGKFTGLTKKSINIQSTDPDNPKSELVFMSRVAKSHPYLDVEPLTANFVQIVEGKGAKQKIKFTNISSMNVRLIPVEAPEDDQIKYKIKDENLKPGESTDLEIELSKKLKPGILKTSITLDAKGAVSERLSIPIQGQIIANP